MKSKVVPYASVFQDYSLGQHVHTQLGNAGSYGDDRKIFIICFSVFQLPNNGF